MLAQPLASLGRPSPAAARGLEAYIRTAKPQQPPEQIAAALLLAREELMQFGASPHVPAFWCCAHRWLAPAEKVLKSSAEFDAADLRALLRAGPFRKFRDSLRTLAKGLADTQAGNADAEACFKQLEALDFILIDLAKAEDKGPGRADATACIGAAISSLDAVLAQLPQETMSAARAALQ